MLHQCKQAGVPQGLPSWDECNHGRGEYRCPLSYSKNSGISALLVRWHGWYRWGYRRIALVGLFLGHKDKAEMSALLSPRLF